MSDQQDRTQQGPNLELGSPGVEEAQRQGFYGQRADPRPLEDHSLESGPDAPSAREQIATMATAPTPASVDPDAGQSDEPHGDPSSSSPESSPEESPQS